MTTPYSSNRKIAIGDITDININTGTLSHNSVIAYNSISKTWENGTEAGSSNILEVSDSNEYNDYNLVFTDGAGIGKTLHVDSLTAPCTINPSNGNLSIVDTLKIGQLSVAVGKLSGTTQKSFSVSIGAFAGQDQSTDSIAVGRNSGQTSQGQDAIAIGRSSGQTEQESNCVAIGEGAGRLSQGTNSISIGSHAGYNYQTANSIILNALGTDLDTSTTGLYVKPIRSFADASSEGESLYYNTITGEISSEQKRVKVDETSEQTYTTGYNASLGDYVIKLSPDKKHGIVCAANDWLPFATWYAAMIKVSEWDASVMTTDELNYLDWRLPTQTELNVIHSFKSELGIDPNWYWTSTDAWGTNKMLIGQMNSASFYTHSYDKNSSIAKTRAVRRF